jgi:DNA-directed RNA polymerase
MNQADWEHKLTRKRLDEKQYNIRTSLSSGHATETAFGQTILNQQINTLADKLHELAEVKTRGVGGAYSQTLVLAATEFNNQGDLKQNYIKIAYIGLTRVLELVYHQEKKRQFASHIAYEIGKALEEEHVLYMFKHQRADLLHVLKHNANSTTYENKEKAKMLAYKVKTEWEDNPLDAWGIKTRNHVGMRVLRAILETMPEYLVLVKVQQATRHEMVVKQTPALNEFLVEHTEYVMRTTITSQPCIEPPLPWVAEHKHIVGGFHTIDCSYNRPFIKTKNTEQREWIAKTPPLKHIEVCNGLQQVGWEVRADVLNLIKQAMMSGIFPEHIPCLKEPEFPPKPEDEAEYYAWKKDRFKLVKLNKARVQKLSALRNVLSMATLLEHKTFWFVYTCDFRGRIYCSSGSLNPQGPKYVRALLQFSEGKALGKEGLYWLAVHGANQYGHSSSSYDDRYQWVMDNQDSIRTVASQPDGSRGRSILNTADDPFGFYAFCREWVAAHNEHDPQTFVSHLPVSLDGSANGIQHYSAMLRDQDGAARVNLTATQTPGDIYGTVAARLRKVLTQDSDHPVEATVILKGGIDRNLVKIPVMTMPYGVTIRGISLAICHYLDDHADKYDLQEGDLKNWSVITYMTEKIIDVIHAEIKAPKIVMNWLQDVAQSVSMEGKHIKWISPVGFPVCQPYERYRESMIQTNLMGSKKIMYRDVSLGIDKTKAKVSLAPNLIHSLDSSHLVMTVQEMKHLGVTDVMCIHDSIGTHACNVPIMKEELRRCMYDLYRHSPLVNFRFQILELVDSVQMYPKRGTYDIDDVLDSEYFFN